MAKWDFKIVGASFVKELVPVDGDVNPRSQSFMQPSFHLEGGKIVMKESGQYVTAIYFSQIGEIDGVAPTDIDDAYAKLLTLVENFNGGGGTPQNLAQTLQRGGRPIKNIDTSDNTQCPDGVYTFVLADSWSYLYFVGNTPIDAVIPDDFYDIDKGVELQGDIQTNANVTMKYNGSGGSVPITSATADIRFNANQVEANIWNFGLSTSSLGGGVESVTGANVDNTDPLNPVVNPTPINASGGGTTIADGVIEHNDLLALGSIIANNGRTKLSQNIADTEAGLYDVSGDRQIATYSETDQVFSFANNNFKYSEATSQLFLDGDVVKGETYNDARYVQIGVDNPTTIVLSSTDLETNYPSSPAGFRVYCVDIIAGAMVYEKTPSGWIGMACIVP